MITDFERIDLAAEAMDTSDLRYARVNEIVAHAADCDGFASLVDLLAYETDADVVEWFRTQGVDF